MTALAQRDDEGAPAIAAALSCHLLADIAQRHLDLGYRHPFERRFILALVLPRPGQPEVRPIRVELALKSRLAKSVWALPRDQSPKLKIFVFHGAVLLSGIRFQRQQREGRQPMLAHIV